MGGGFVERPLGAGVELFGEPRQGFEAGRGDVRRPGGLREQPIRTLGQFDLAVLAGARRHRATDRGEIERQGTPCLVDGAAGFPPLFAR